MDSKMRFVAGMVAVMAWGGCTGTPGLSSGGPTPDAPEVAEPAPAPAVVAPAPAPAEPAAAAAKLDVNAATEEQLRAVPGASEKMAHEFVDYRPYVSIVQFRKEIGKYVDAATVAGYEQHLYVPVDPDTCDAETLQQLPGVDAADAAALIAARPFASRDAFLAALADKATPEEIEAGRALLKAQ